MHSPSITAQPSPIVSATHHTTSNNSEGFSLLSRQSELHTTQHQPTSTHTPMRMTTTTTFPTSNGMIFGSTTSNTSNFLQSSSNIPYNNNQQQQQPLITFNNRQDMMVISSSPSNIPNNPFTPTSSSSNQSSSSTPTSSSSIQPLANVQQVNQNMYNRDQTPSFITSTVPMSTVMQPSNNTTSSSTSLTPANNNTNSSLRFVVVTTAAGRYEGEVNTNNERHGKGTMYFTGGGFYKGFWVNDKMEGKGEYAWGDGNHYLGMFKNGKQNGVGVYEWPSGGKYIGHWRDDKMHGFGTYKRDDGIVYFGLWEDDHQSGMGLKVVPARFCHGDTKKSFARRKFREIWKDKTLIYQKEIIEMPNVLALQEKKRLTDITIVCQSDEEQCYQDPIALQRFLRSSSSNLTLDFAKYFTISQNSDEESEPNRRKHYLEHDDDELCSPSDSKLTKYSHNSE